MDVLLYITSFKISFFPLAEILKRKCWSFYAVELTNAFHCLEILKKKVESLKSVWVNKTHFIVLWLLIVILWKKL